MVIFTKKFGTLDLHLPIVWDKVLKNRFFTPSLKGLRRRRRAQLPAHHLQGASNIVFNILQAKDQIAAYVRNRAFSNGIPSKEIQTREAFSFQGEQICCLPIQIFFSSGGFLLYHAEPTGPCPR